MGEGIGFGTTLKWNTVAVVRIISDIPFPNITVDDMDWFNQNSPDQFGEWKPGKRDAGEITIECIFKTDDPAQIAAIEDMIAGNTREVIITGPTAMAFTWTFDAYVKGFSGGSPLNDKITISLTLKITGKPVLGIDYVTGPADIVINGNISGGLDLLPTYDDGVYEYAVDGSGDASVTVTVTQGEASSVIKVNGNTVESEVPSSAIALTADEITTITVVVSKNGKASLTYIIRVSDASA